MKPFTMVAVIVFALIAVLQVCRFLLGWVVVVNGITIPVWASGAAFVIAAALAVLVWREARG